MKMRPTVHWQDDVWWIDLAKRELRSASDAEKIVRVDTLAQALLDELEASIEERTEEYAVLLEMIYAQGDVNTFIAKKHQLKGWYNDNA